MDDRLYIVKTFDDKHIENNAYFKKYEEALRFVTFNVYDINDGGVFDYAMIHTVHYNEAYTEYLSDMQSFYKFDKDRNMYFRINREEGLKALKIMYDNKFKKIVNN